jgi:hypothetical protein
MRTYLTNRIVELRRLQREDGHLQYLFRTREAQRALDRLNEMEADARPAGEAPPPKPNKPTPADGVMDTCYLGHKFIYLPDHPRNENGNARCPHCLAHFRDKHDERVALLTSSAAGLKTANQVKAEIIERERKALLDAFKELREVKRELARRKEIVSSTTVVLHRDRDGCVVHSEEIKPNPWTGL